MADEMPLLFVPVGDNPARPFGMDARERVCRLAVNAGFECAEEPVPGRPVLLASMKYAWDPLWLKVMRERPGVAMTSGDRPIMVHVPADRDASGAERSLDQGTVPEGYDRLEFNDRRA